MLGTLLKKRLSDTQLANVFLNGIFEIVDNGFVEVVDLINEDLAFVTSPSIPVERNGQFTMIVVVANISSLETTFETVQANRIEKIIFEQLGSLMGVSAADAEAKVREYQKFMQRINHPSKNMVYAMSKAVFQKYDLNDFQDEYFKRLQSPNPLFLKRMDQVMINFLWDWDSFFKKYKIDE
ncbi:hypothetical protein FO442_10770 [Fluviicola chungangensis]|uniref:Uncharacterized protein n=1 Tax=Fluviicola chungangensis TaxID=2597671 RepID=A0A556MYR3_9FLAO|nr:hypothetical protein FO442_10770 [Fluviicola chungangensis]